MKRNTFRMDSSPCSMEPNHLLYLFLLPMFTIHLRVLSNTFLHSSFTFDPSAGVGWKTQHHNLSDLSTQASLTLTGSCKTQRHFKSIKLRKKVNLECYLLHNSMGIPLQNDMERWIPDKCFQRLREGRRGLWVEKENMRGFREQWNAYFLNVAILTQVYTYQMIGEGYIGRSYTYFTTCMWV